MAEKAFTATSTCETCDVSATWEGTDSPSKTDMTCVDHESTFICDHWGDHHQAVDLALLEDDARAQSGPVKAHVVWEIRSRPIPLENNGGH